MNIFTSIKQQKLSSTDGTFSTANTIKLTQTEITQLETEDFFSNATQNNCELIIFPIKVSDVLTSEEDVYKLTAAIFDNIDAITAENGKGAELSIENATSGMTVPFHAGAAKYFAEKGVTVSVE